MTKRGRQTFVAAARHIYDPQPSDWTGRFELLLIGRREDRDAARDALQNAGFGSPLPGVWVAPSGVSDPRGGRAGDTARSVRRGRQRPPSAQRKLAARSYGGRLFEIHQDFRTAVRLDQRRARLSDTDAFTARILLIHYYRRVVLRDPLLPAALLPSDWPGTAARRLCGAIYRGLLPASEHWLDGSAMNENGPLPAAGAELARRFAD